MRKLFLLLFAMACTVCSAQTSDPKEHIYEAERLRVIKDSVTVNGTVTLVSSEMDGDYHIRLRMDSDSLVLSPKNFTKQDSCLVLEIVCAHKSIIPLCKCDDYTNGIPVPFVGQRIRVTGRVVYDKRHRWTELHPVYGWRPPQANEEFVLYNTTTK